MELLLQIENLSVSFHTDDGIARAVDRVSLAIAPGETLGVVGESGCGKTVTALSILRLIQEPPGRIDGGRIVYKGQNLLEMTDRLRTCADATSTGQRQPSPDRRRRAASARR